MYIPKVICVIQSCHPTWSAFGGCNVASLPSSPSLPGSAMFLGDMLCLLGAGIYAAGNVCQEYLVKSHSIVEYLGLIGVVGSFVSGAQL